MQFVQYHLKARNTLHTWLIFLAMNALLMLIGYLILDVPGIAFALFLVVLAFIITPRLSPDIVLRLYRTQALTPLFAGELYAMVEDLTQKAGLQRSPTLHYLPSAVLNSFTVGDKNNYKIVLSDGLIRSLTRRELYGVLAHEISHVKNNDLQVMAFADVMSRVTAIMSLTGILTLLVSLPLVLMGSMAIPILGLLLLTFAPNIAALLQLALSRTREFIADQQAVELTGDPLGLASALEKIDAVERHWAKRLLVPHYRLAEPSLLRTHPLSEERIKRLQRLADQSPSHGYLEESALPNHLRDVRPRYKPRHRIHGMWY